MAGHAQKCHAERLGLLFITEVKLCDGKSLAASNRPPTDFAIDCNTLRGTEGATGCDVTPIEFLSATGLLRIHVCNWFIRLQPECQTILS